MIVKRLNLGRGSTASMKCVFQCLVGSFVFLILY